MKHALTFLALAATVLASTAAFAAAPAGAPAGSNGLCKDGTYSTNATKKGACAGHKGVKDWFGPTDAAAPAAAPTAAAAPAPTATPAAPVKPAPAAATPPAATTAPAAAAPGGGAGKVWVNAGSKVYHCPGTKYYGKTKQGEYMTEAAAKAGGNHADHGKACTP